MDKTALSRRITCKEITGKRYITISTASTHVRREKGVFFPGGGGGEMRRRKKRREKGKAVKRSAMRCRDDAVAKLCPAVKKQQERDILGFVLRELG